MVVNMARVLEIDLVGKSRWTVWRYCRRLDEERRQQGLEPLFVRKVKLGWWRVNSALLSSPPSDGALWDHIRDLEREVLTLRKRLGAVGARMREIERHGS